jgi:hypothetical protein
MMKKSRYLVLRAATATVVIVAAITGCERLIAFVQQDD